MSNGTGRIDELLDRARARFHRVTPAEAFAELARGALLVDTRTNVQRSTQGEVPGALVIDRTVLEWRLDPTSPHRIPEARPGQRVIVLCRQGYSSSLAAASLLDLEIDASDVIDGVEGWIRAGLPISTAPGDVRP